MIHASDLVDLAEMNYNLGEEDGRAKIVGALFGLAVKYEGRAIDSLDDLNLPVFHRVVRYGSFHKLSEAYEEAARQVECNFSFG